MTYAGAYFRAGVPDTDDPDVAGNKNQAPALLPIEYESGVLVARYEICQSTESRHKLCFAPRVIVAEYLDDSIRGSCH
jgi:hypothetical protein